MAPGHAPPADSMPHAVFFRVVGPTLSIHDVSYNSITVSSVGPVPNPSASELCVRLAVVIGQAKGRSGITCVPVANVRVDSLCMVTPYM